MFELHERLAADTFAVDDWDLCTVRLMDDARFPWLILVPRRDGLRDFHDVATADRGAFHDEIDLASRALAAMTSAEKMNVAALGNMVPQLHVHVIARFAKDAGWPGPVWSAEGMAEPYADDQVLAFVARFQEAARASAA